MRTLVIGDIHGCYELLNKLLQKVNFQKNQDRIIFIGDYIDRGPEARKVLDLVMELVNEGAIALLGNHEEMFVAAYENFNHITPWILNGGRTTLASFGIDKNEKEGIREIPVKYIEFLKSLPLYYETKDYIFVHAGLDPQIQNPLYTNKYAMLWIRDEWLNCNYRGKKKVIFGHTPTLTINDHWKAEPWISGNKICLDTGGVYSKYGGRLSCLELPGMNFSYVG